MEKKSTLRKKLASYSALATVVLAGSKSAEGQIIYTDLNPDDTIHVVGDYLLDLNNDGTIDFKFNLMHRLTSYGGTYPSVDQIRVVGYGNNSILRDTIPTYSSYAYAKVLPGGALIGGSALFSNEDILATNSFSGYWYWGNWRGVTDGFLGLKIMVGLNTYYGWTRLSIDSVCDQLIVSDYAIDTVTNEAITAGDKCGNYSAYANTVITPSDSVPLCEGSNVVLTTDSIAGFTYQWMVNGAVIAGANNFTYVTASGGKYNVMITTAYGCVDTTLETTVILFPLPDSPVISLIEDTLVSTAASAYQWYLNSIIIPGATDQAFAPSQQGDYTVQITDENGCMSLSNAYSFIPDRIVNPESKSISVFETNNIVVVQLNDAKFLGGEIKIFNALGSIVYSSILNSETLQIDLNHGIAGIYLLTVEKSGVRVVRKIEVQ